MVQGWVTLWACQPGPSEENPDARLRFLMLRLSFPAPKGLKQESPGQRPGNRYPEIAQSPEGASQKRSPCLALSGLDRGWSIRSQGVALG